jgi:hypothetical protein
MPGAQRLDAQGHPLNARRGKVAEDRVEAWSHGLQESTFGRVPGLSHNDRLGSFYDKWLNPESKTEGAHTTFAHGVDAAKEGAVQTGSSQPTRESDNRSEYTEELERWARENPGYDGSLVNGPDE